MLIDIFNQQGAPKTVTWDMFQLLKETFKNHNSTKKSAINSLTIDATKTALTKAREDYKDQS